MGLTSGDLSGARQPFVDWIVKGFDCAASCFDFLPGNGADAVDFDRERLGDFAACQHDDRVVGVAQQPNVGQGGLGHLGLWGKEPVQLVEIDRHIDHLETIVESTQFGQPFGERQLSALEIGADLPSVAGVLALLAAAAGLAFA